MPARKASPSRRWSFTCPVCRHKVRVNKDGMVAAHFGEASPWYCEGSRTPALYPTRERR